jgi:predicted lipoprotein with Yx(FWY)xxD motif
MHAIENQTVRTGSGSRVRRGRRRAWIAAPFALGTLALAACSSPYGTSTAASSASAPASAGTGPLVGPSSTGLGTILVDSRGRTVYDFANDKAGTPTCNGSCAAIWMPVAAPATPPASLPGVPARLGSVNRSDGTQQLTVAGHPVYTYAGDSAAGQTNGQGLTLNGGLWTVLSPAGKPLAAGSASGGSGY